MPGADGGGLAEATVSAEPSTLTWLAVLIGTGGAKPLSDKDRLDIQKQARKILGNAARASFTSQRVVPSSGSAAGQPVSGSIDGTLTLHGAWRSIRLEVTSHELGRYEAITVVLQADGLRHHPVLRLLRRPYVPRRGDRPVGGCIHRHHE